MGKSRGIERWKRWASRLQVDVYALYLAGRHPGVPWYAKVLAACVVGYAFSPIDLIPDFIPVLGYLDDLIVVPLGIALALRMIPRPVLDQCREKARERLSQDRPKNWAVAGIVITVWLLLTGVVVVTVVGAIQG